MLMNSFTLSSAIFALMIVGIFLGALLRRKLPRHHLDEHAKDVVRLGVGLIATIAALVLGLLISAAKTSFDTQSTQIKQLTANVIQLDSVLAHYGPDAHGIRVHLRDAVGPFADRIWQEKNVAVAVPFETNVVEEQIYSEIQRLSPRNDLQRRLHSRAVQITNDLAQIRFLLFADSDNPVPTPFLAILTLWLVIVFASYSLFARLNGTLFTCLSFFAFSAACAIFLILELSRPFTGLMMLSSAPLRNALGGL